jgi:hypothetical protein
MIWRLQLAGGPYEREIQEILAPRPKDRVISVSSWWLSLKFLLLLLACCAAKNYLVAIQS